MNCRNSSDSVQHLQCALIEADQNALLAFCVFFGPCFVLRQQRRLIETARNITEDLLHNGIQ